MAVTDVTNDFREVVTQKLASTPESKRHKVTRRTLSSSSPKEGSDSIGKQYVAEAGGYPKLLQLNHITTLTRMLAGVKKPYLNVDSRSPPSRQGSNNLTFDGLDWSNVRYLTNEERDQIDLQAREILTRCSERTKELEALEKRRVELVASKRNTLSRFLPARLRQDESTIFEDFVAAHHSSITWYLSRRLAEASRRQKEMQEERIRRQIDRTRTLGSGAALEAQNVASKKRFVASAAEQSGSGSWLAGASSSLLAATLGTPTLGTPTTRSVPIPGSGSVSTWTPSDDEDDEIELSASQIMQFESENANILRTVQDTLESVQQAEASLLDISALQAELVTHLTKQTELTNQLYEDAIATTSTVEKGNEQLREAKRRAKGGRLFILLFLVGASLSLLFLHYY